MDPHEFEEAVRNAARLRWPSGSGRRDIVGGIEIDAHCRVDQLHILIDATISRNLREIKRKCESLRKAILFLRKENSPASAYIVTLHNPSPEQIEFVEKQERILIQIVSLQELSAEICDGNSYLTKRENHQYGSIQNLVDEEASVPRELFVPPLMTNNDRTIDVDNLYSGLKNGLRYFLVAEYGSGKSMTLRELYYRARDSYISREHIRFPVYINMSEHYGTQFYPEVLERHARLIGFDGTSNLVAAWKAGSIDLFLDGYDELGVAPWSNKAKDVSIQRRKSLDPFRQLVKHTPRICSIFVAGRSNFFDNSAELFSAFGVERSDAHGTNVGKKFSQIEVREFDHERIEKLLKQHGRAVLVPTFVPRKPAFLAYLIESDLLHKLDDTGKSLSRGEIWDALIEIVVSRRESSQRQDILSAAIVRQLIELLANVSRTSVNGNRPLSSSDIRSAFVSVTGRDPEPEDQTLIARLPGLGPAAGANQTRSFVDDELRMAAAAGSICQYIEMVAKMRAADFERFEVLAEPINFLAIEVLAVLLDRNHIDNGMISRAFDHASSKKHSQMAADLFSTMSRLGIPYIGNSAILSSGYFDELSFDDGVDKTYCKISITDSIIKKLQLPDAVSMKYLPPIVSSIIVNAHGDVAFDSLPKEKFESTDFENYEFSTERNSTILSAGLPLKTKALLTVLQKLFLQPGSARLEQAFTSGVPSEVRIHISEILPLLVRHDFAYPTRVRRKKIWRPRRDKTHRVRSMFKDLSSSNDPLFLAVMT
ncbi:MAG: hypothetical protein AAGK33_06095 [Pseudomonadota bacterium]